MKFLYIFCFLIISCDLPGEADTDCNGDQDGLAFIDDCGVCSGGNTNLIPNNDAQLCGECFDYSCLDYQCSDSLAINYYSDPDYVDNDLCIYDLCTDYLESTDFDCSFNANPPYDINDQLGCETLETEFSLCYPENCETTFKFSDFEDKIIWIIYEADW